MKPITGLLLLLTLLSCQIHSGISTSQKEHSYQHFLSGNFAQVITDFQDYFLHQNPSQADLKWMEMMRAKIDRIQMDFSKNEDQILQQLRSVYPNLTSADLADWEASGALEMRMINAEKRYFKYAVNNLFRIDQEAQEVRNNLLGIRPDGLMDLRVHYADQLIKQIDQDLPQDTIHWEAEFSMSLDANAVPANEVVRCWLPFPKPHPTRQFNIKLIETSESHYELAEANSLHRTLYMEKPAIANQSTVFKTTFSFSTLPKKYFLVPNSQISQAISPHDPELFLGEQAPHLVFSDQVKQLADSITEHLEHPIDQAKALFHWISDNIPWASALEYSTFECIPDYVIKNRHGDCGMVSFLLLSLARYKGIPAKWQSGWMLHPGYKNLHDWCELYFEGYGWVPFDPSFGLQQSADKRIQEFYIGGIDPYRLIINDGTAAEFSPPKKYYRSEPHDFQRGEMEWSGGNLYFNLWDYSLQIKMVNE